MADALRDQLARALAWEDARAGLDKAIAGVPADKRGARPPGFEHSIWQQVEHIRLAQADILDFCVNPNYEHTMKWPDDYWPVSPEPPNATAWDGAVAALLRDRETAQRLTRDTADLTASVPTGNDNQTYLRAILLLIDHGAYHVGQIVGLRRALGIWP